MFSLNVAATTGIYTYGPTLPVHTALPIWSADARRPRSVAAAVASEVHRSRAAHVGHDRRQRKGGGGGGPVKAQFDAVEAMRAHGRRDLPVTRLQQFDAPASVRPGGAFPKRPICRTRTATRR